MLALISKKASLIRGESVQTLGEIAQSLSIHSFSNSSFCLCIGKSFASQDCHMGDFKNTVNPVM